MMENSVSNDVPEQTYNDDSLFRPMSLANVSGIADPSTDKSKMLHQIWNEHRSPRDTGTPLNEEEDIEGDHTSTPAVKVHSTSIFMYSGAPVAFKTWCGHQYRVGRICLPPWLK